MMNGYSRFREIAKERAYLVDENQEAIERQKKFKENCDAAMALHDLLKKMGIFAYCTSGDLEIDGVLFTSYIQNKGQSNMGSSLEHWDLQVSLGSRFRDAELLKQQDSEYRFVRGVRTVEEVGRFIRKAEDKIRELKAKNG